MPESRCTDCGEPLFETDGITPPCPECGSTRRTVQISAHGRLSFKGHANLTRFVDYGSPDAGEASLTALSEIALWFSDPTRRLTCKHIVAGNLTASGAGVPLGPFDDEKGRQIVATIMEDVDAQQSERWDRVRSFMPWIIGTVSAVAAVASAWLAYLNR